MLPLFRLNNCPEKIGQLEWNRLCCLHPDVYRKRKRYCCKVVGLCKAKYEIYTDDYDDDGDLKNDAEDENRKDEKLEYE